MSGPRRCTPVVCGLIAVFLAFCPLPSSTLDAAQGHDVPGAIHSKSLSDAVVDRVAVTPVPGIPVIEPSGDQCRRIEPGEDSPVARVWAGAVDPLSAAAQAEAEHRYEFEVERWVQSADLASGWVFEEQREEPTRSTRTFETPSARVLLTEGWVRLADAGDSYDYYGLDAATLTSIDFLETHCLELRDHPTDDERVGIAFEPDPASDRPRVRGVLWLDRDTSRPLELAFHYTAHPEDLAIPEEHLPRFDGVVSFRELPDGGWIANRWTLGMPQWWEDEDGGDHLGRLEIGGAVLSVVTELGRHDLAREVAALEGVVVDSTLTTEDAQTGRDMGLDGADVRLPGTNHRARTDAEGRFRIEVPSGGRYLVEFTHSRLDELAIEAIAPLEVDLVRGETATLELAVPSIRTLAMLECGREVGTGTEGIVRGRVLESSAPLAGVSVRLEPEGGGADPVEAWETVTTADGHFQFCEVPTDTDLRVETAFFGVPGESRRLRLTEEEAVTMDLSLDLVSEGVIRGVVQEGVSGPPIGNASVRVAGRDVDRTVTADARGRFEFPDILSGSYDLQASHLGYQSMETQVDVAGGGRVTNVTVRLLRDAIALDPIVVEVESRPSWGPLAQVYDRRDYMQQLGVGHFFDREAIEREGGSQLTRMVSRLPGVRLRPVERMGTMASALRIHRTNDCQPAYFVDGMPYRLGDSPQPGRDDDLEEMDRMPESIDDVVSLAAVEMIEVYRGANQLPMEFATDHAARCGAIAIWTRRGH